MKKYLLVFSVMIGIFISINNVYADEVDTSVYKKNKTIITNIYNDLMTEYKNYSDYKYYNVSFQYAYLTEDFEVAKGSLGYISGLLYYFTSPTDFSSNAGRIIVNYACHSSCEYTITKEKVGSSGYGQFNQSILKESNNFKNYAGNLILSDGKSPDYFINSIDNKYTEVNLNDYAYIALFLKDYSKTKAFSTTTYVKGQSCITPLYNFSTSLKPDKSENICSPVYSDYTASDIYVLKSDIENKAVYYVSKYDSSIENSIKIDTSVFDIFYVKEEDAANPTFNYKGNEYAGIGLDNVDYSANKNTENGLVPGESKNVADTFADVIKKPLELFKNISSGLTSFFSLITSFLGFLPTELQGFLYFSFVVAIVLGIIKIIL